MFIFKFQVYVQRVYRLGIDKLMNVDDIELFWIFCRFCVTLIDEIDIFCIPQVTIDFWDW